MKIIAFTGAGISKQSNIPTFMERPDVREKLFRSYANTHHEEYNEVIKQLKANMNGAKPNDAHIALSEYHVPIITMNIDGLHKLAGSDALELHGGLPEDDEMDIAYSLYNKPVLYGDPAPNYQKAYEAGESSVEFLEDYIRFMVEEGRKDLAAPALQEALKVDPFNPEFIRYTFIFEE